MEQADGVGWQHRSRGWWQRKRQKQGEMGEDLGEIWCWMNHWRWCLISFQTLQLPGDTEQLQGWKSHHLAGRPVLNMKSCVDCCLSPNPSLAACLLSPPMVQQISAEKTCWKKNNTLFSWVTCGKKFFFSPFINAKTQLYLWALNEIMSH